MVPKNMIGTSLLLNPLVVFGSRGKDAKGSKKGWRKEERKGEREKGEEERGKKEGKKRKNEGKKERRDTRTADITVIMSNKLK